MNHLPKDIVDLCGIKMGDAPYAPAGAGTMTPALVVVEDGEGVSTLEYNGALVGWINEIKLNSREGKTYRAMTVRGTVHHGWSMTMAKAWLIEEAI
jgi:hypothetical protein